MGETVLREIADREICWPDDGTRVGFLEAGQHLEQCGFTGAIRATKADTIPVSDLPCDTIEQDTVAERLRKLRKLDQSNS